MTTHAAFIESSTKQYQVSRPVLYESGLYTGSANLKTGTRIYSHVYEEWKNKELTLFYVRQPGPRQGLRTCPDLENYQ